MSVACWNGILGREGDERGRERDEFKGRGGRGGWWREREGMRGGGGGRRRWCHIYKMMWHYMLDLRVKLIHFIYFKGKIGPKKTFMYGKFDLCLKLPKQIWSLTLFYLIIGQISFFFPYFFLKFLTISTPNSFPTTYYLFSK